MAALISWQLTVHEPATVGEEDVAALRAQGGDALAGVEGGARN
eukprot:COSAG04_NODE_10405_length_779_cov_1.867647_3_plen_42_part_01